MRGGKVGEGGREWGVGKGEEGGGGGEREEVKFIQSNLNQFFC